MKHVRLLASSTERLPFYLAMEEFLALRYPEDEYFFLWQVNPTVIFGRNQLIENEVNLDYVKSHGIEFYRRKSGGGCVYADYSNIMFSFVTPHLNSNYVFDEYLGRIVGVLKSLGLPASFSGRNDILIDNLKVSGNAFYRVNNKSVVHGTMLYDTDLEVMVRAITPNNEKLLSKGIDSVRKRVTNLCEHFQMPIEDFKKYMVTHLCDGEITLSDEDVLAIRRIEEGYLKDDFIYGKNPKYSIIRSGRVEAGTLEISLELKNGTIKHVNILGDYFLIGDPDGFLKRLEGVKYIRQNVSDALNDVNLSDYVYNLEKSAFLDIMFQEG